MAHGIVFLGGTSGPMVVCVCVCMCVCVCVRLCVCVSVCVCVWDGIGRKERVSGKVVEWVGGWIDGCLVAPVCVCVCVRTRVRIGASINVLGIWSFLCSLHQRSVVRTSMGEAHTMRVVISKIHM